MTATEGVQRRTSPPTSTRSITARRFLSGWHAVVLLGAIYFALSLLVDPLSSLGSDVGGKTATMERLAETGSPDLGYWAADLDPAGDLHPMYGMSQYGDVWVNATTFPMLLAALPLFKLGGMHLAMLVPLSGGLLAATAGRRLARTLQPTSGDAAFWIVGLATPVAVYSLAFWEHALGLGLMAWGVVWVLGSIEATSLRAGALAGLCFGVAATMRQEALVYGFTAGVFLVGSLLQRRQLVNAITCGGAMVFGAVGALAANAGLELWVIGNSARTARASGAASGFGANLGDRLHDAVLTTLTPGSVSFSGIQMALVLVAALVVMSVVPERSRRWDQAAIAAGVVVGFVVLVAVVGYRSFVPSLLFSTPLAVVGAALGWRDARVRPVVILALGSLPLVWASQSTGALGAQWGGRYLLLSGWILTAVAASYWRTAAGLAVRFGAVSSLAITSLGVWWTIERSNDVAQSHAAIVALDAPVVVFNSSLTGRGGGISAVDHRWLSAENEEERGQAAALISTAGFERFVYIELEPENEPPRFDEFRPAGEDRIDFLIGLQFRATTFELVGS